MVRLQGRLSGGSARPDRCGRKSCRQRFLLAKSGAGGVGDGQCRRPLLRCRPRHRQQPIGPDPRLLRSVVQWTLGVLVGELILF